MLHDFMNDAVGFVLPLGILKIFELIYPEKVENSLFFLIFQLSFSIYGENAL